MTPASYFLVLLILSHPLLFHSAEEEEEKQSDDIKCPPFYCKNLNYTHAYGWLTVDNCSELIQKIQLESGGEWCDVISISPAANIKIHNQSWLLDHFRDSCTCKSSENFLSPSISFNTTSNLTQSQCYGTPYTYFSYIRSGACSWYSHGHPQIRPTLPLPQCSTIKTPMSITHINDHLFSLPAADIFFQVRLSEFCFKCYYKGSECNINSRGNFQCDKGNNKLKVKVGLASGIGFLAALLICLLVFFIRRCHYKQKHGSSDFLMSNISADPTSKLDLDRGVVYFGVPIFSYGELEEATNNFDPTKKLGDGGFGTVYHGKLQDGREVAVKRLYENSNKQVEQFMNEVEILTRLRHKNLVSLYGCTSRHSRELLLVYEFIPNGTVADHLHDDRAKPGSLTWPIRMSIAIETAEALAYLHATDIIHRDVKTNNILLDSNFCVKVADFGLSRLFPIDCTHVLTTPQGTPGYLDPDYHQCYQLSDKSDVYSFAVVLIELISSMPAVDMSRNRHEINLANFAMNKIQNCAFDELVDPSLGFESNFMVRRMSTSVAELAFRCLQPDKEMRPSMDEVLEVLKGIESEEYETEDDVGVLKSIRPPTSPDFDHVRLLKNMQRLPSSPNSVTEKWVSRSTTPSASAEAIPHSLKFKVDDKNML